MRKIVFYIYCKSVCIEYICHALKIRDDIDLIDGE